MARRGRPRKSGDRSPNGRLRSTQPGIDRGHELTLLQRARTLDGADPRDPRAATPLGILALRGKIDDDEYLAGEAYEKIHQRFWGGMPGRPEPAPRSHLCQFIASSCPVLWDIADVDPETARRRCGKTLQECEARLRVFCGSGHGFRILERTVVYHQPMRFMDTARRRQPSAWAADNRDLADLKLALREVMHILGIRRQQRPRYVAGLLAAE